ncbi:MAG: DUF1684 domain-containing protein [Bacteroidia bacterium]|nr:DUF1684 domain-containing protein [Bacteroidia bacterium]
MILFLVVLASCSTQDKWDSQSNSTKKIEISEYERAVIRYQDSMSVAFMTGENDVLKKADISPINHLNFFEPNEAYKVSARFIKINGGEIIQMATNTNRLPEYRHFGELQFELKGDSLSLMLYQSLGYPDYLFCPFKDLTNGKESYGAGRYLDFKLSDTLNPIVDFNYSYNPYCAYNSDYSCPIPPRANHLKVRIEAGVKAWH